MSAAARLRKRAARARAALARHRENERDLLFMFLSGVALELGRRVISGALAPEPTPKTEVVDTTAEEVAD